VNIRRSLSLILTVAASGLLIMLMLWTTELALSVWEKLQQLPDLLRFFVLFLLAAGAAMTVWSIWKLLAPQSEKKAVVRTQKLNEGLLRDAMDNANAKGIDIIEAKQELLHLDPNETLSIALSGRISVGKSSLINALIPGNQAATDIRGGTTSQQQVFRGQLGDTVIEVIDLPGSNNLVKEKQNTETPHLDSDKIAWEHAARSHLVIYVTDGDLDKQQSLQLKTLIALDKPVILAMNKSDSYSDSELKILLTHLQTQWIDQVESIIPLSTQSAEGMSQLYPAMLNLLDNHDLLNQRREQAVLQLAQQKLRLSEQQYQQLKGTELVRSHTHQAILGALAAVTPGSDLVIQGVLASKLIKSICELYNISPKELNMSQFLKMAGSKVKRNSAITLAVSGNALKSFPGIGTIAGGLMHAVAYGMIFQSLGNAVIESIQEDGEFNPKKAEQKFSEQLNALSIQENALQQTSTQEILKMVKTAVAERIKRPPS